MSEHKDVHSPMKPTAAPGAWFLRTPSWSSRTQPEQKDVTVYSNNSTQDLALSYEKKNQFCFNICLKNN